MKRYREHYMPNNIVQFLMVVADVVGNCKESGLSPLLKSQGKDWVCRN